MRLPYNRDGDARPESRIKALKETILQQSMVAFGLFEIQFFHAPPQGRENELIYALDDTCMEKKY